MDRERERKIVIEGRKQGKSDEFIKQAVLRDRERRSQAQPVQTAANWASNVPGLKQVQDFGVGVGSAIGNAGIGLGQLALKGGMGFTSGLEKATGGFLKADNSLAQDTYDQMEKLKQGIFNKPFEGNKATISGQAGTVVGSLAPMFSGGGITPATGGSLIGRIASNVAQAAPKAIPDMIVAAGQAQGANQSNEDILKNTVLAGGLSTLGLASMPGAGAGIKRTILGNAATGYTGDIITGLTGQRGKDREGYQALIPGAGTAIGTGVGILQAYPAIKMNLDPEFRRKMSQDTTIQNRAQEIYDIDTKYAKGRKANRFINDEGAASRARVASTDVLVDSVDSDGMVRTMQKGGAHEQYKAQTVDVYEGRGGIVRAGLEQEGATVSLDVVKTKLIDKIKKSGLQGRNLVRALSEIDSEIEGYKLALEGDNVPLTLMHDAKVDTYESINFQTPPEVSKSRKAIAQGLKEIVEENSKTNVKKINEVLSTYYQDLSLIERLDGARVKGGRLGKYFAQVGGNIVGGTVGSVGGPVGSAAGAIAGGEASRAIQGSLMKGTFGKATGMTAPRSDILQDASQSLPKKALTSIDTPNTARPMSAPNNIDTTVPQPSKASTPLSTATRQGVQKSSSLVKNTKLTVAEQTQNNIVLALIDEGDKALANKIAKISMEGAKSADDIASRIRKELGDEVLKNTDVAPHLKSAEMMFDFQKSTMQKVKDAILPGDTPNKEGGFVSIGKKTNGTTWTVTYVKNGKKTTMKGMSTENMQDWTQYLDSKGIKYKRSSA